MQPMLPLALIVLTNPMLDEKFVMQKKQHIFLINLVDSRNLSTKSHPSDFVKSTIKVKLHFSIDSRQPHLAEWGQRDLIQGGAAQ